MSRNVPEDNPPIEPCASTTKTRVTTPGRCQSSFRARLPLRDTTRRSLHTSLHPCDLAGASCTHRAQEAGRRVQSIAWARVRQVAGEAASCNRSAQIGVRYRGDVLTAEEHTAISCVKTAEPRLVTVFGPVHNESAQLLIGFGNSECARTSDKEEIGKARYGHAMICRRPALVGEVALQRLACAAYYIDWASVLTQRNECVSERVVIVGIPLLSCLQGRRSHKLTVTNPVLSMMASAENVSPACYDR